MDLPADVAEQALDRAVDVLVLGLDPATCRDLTQPRLHLGELGVVEQAAAWRRRACSALASQS